jgi:hypothetical protein
MGCFTKDSANTVLVNRDDERSASSKTAGSNGSTTCTPTEDPPSSGFRMTDVPKSVMIRPYNIVNSCSPMEVKLPTRSVEIRMDGNTGTPWSRANSFAVYLCMPIEEVAGSHPT